MGFNWLAFAGGAAEAGTKFIEEQRRTAAARSEAQVKQMLVDYSAKKKKSEQTIEEYSKNVEIIRSAFPDATEAQLVDIAHNPLVMDKVVDSVKAGTFDPNIVDLSGIKKVTKDNDPKTAAEIIADLYDLDTTPKPQAAAAPKKQTGISGFIKRIGQSEAEDTAESLASVAGLSVDELKAARDYSPTPYTSKSKLNMEAVADISLSFDERVDRVKTQIAKNRELVMSIGDTASPEADKARNALNQSLQKLNALTYAESMASTKDKTEAEIQTDLINQYQEETDPAKKAQIKATLDERKRLAKALTEGNFQGNKVTTANIMSAVRRGFNNILKNSVEDGTFMMGPDGELTLTSIHASELNKKAFLNAQEIAIKNAVDEKGMPKSAAHRLGLESIGVSFDNVGRPKAYLPPKFDAIPKDNNTGGNNGGANQSSEQTTPQADNDANKQTEKFVTSAQLAKAAADVNMSVEDYLAKAKSQGYTFTISGD